MAGHGIKERVRRSAWRFQLQRRVSHGAPAFFAGKHDGRVPWDEAEVLCEDGYSAAPKELLAMLDAERVT